MSRYSSIASSSSRSVTKCSWLRSSRRSSPDSLTISIRAVSGCDRISEEIDVSVLKRKCGLIWLASASTRAAISSFSCSCSRCSMRALFQILMGTATHEHRREDDERQQPRVRRAVVEEARRLAEPVAQALPDDLEADRRGEQDHDPVDLEAPHQPPDVAVQVGEEQRREVPDRFLRADLAQAAAGEAAADGEGQGNPFAGDHGGKPTMTPTIAPAYGPASRPARNEPASVRSAAS